MSDFNADGNADLAVANRVSDNVGILLGNGSGGFAAAVTYGPGGRDAESMAAGDFNADGKTDFAVANSSSNNVGILLGNGSGGFARVVTYASAGWSPRFVIAGDFNADGRTDLAVAHYLSSNISVLLNAAEQRPSVHDLQSSHAIRFAVQARGFGAGQMAEGSGNAFDGAGRLEVAGQTYAPVIGSGFLTDANQTVVTPMVVIAGLYVSREITVPGVGDEDFARTIDVFTNVTGSNITVPVRIVGNLGSDSQTMVWKTSGGDSVVETTDQWIGTDDADGSGTPAIIHYIHGPRGLQPTTVRLTGDRGDNIEWTYDVTVPAGQTVRLVHFTILADTRDAAETAAGALVTPDGFGGQAAAFLAQAEVDSLVNFDLPPTDITLSASSVEENQPVATLVADLSTTDSDLPADSHRYTLVSGEGDTDNAAFQIVGNRLQTGAVLDFETQSSYSVRIRSTDAFGLFCEKAFTITIHDVDDTAPSVTGTTPSFAADGSLAAGTTSLAISFNEPVVGGEVAANYQLQSLGPDALLGTADDMVLPLSVECTGTTATIGFTPLSDGVYRLRIGDGITDLTGNRLDGDADGSAGGDWVREFTTYHMTGELFETIPTFPTAPVVGPRAIAAADFNRDGFLDLVTANIESDNVALALGDGSGGFVIVGTFSSGGRSPIALATGDFNIDGMTDVAVVNQDGNSIGILLGNGSAGFAATSSFASGGRGPNCIAAADFNGDGSIDLAVLNASSNNVGMLLGNGSGAFAMPTTSNSGGSSPRSLAVGDYNRDGVSDVAVLNSTTIAILLGNGSGGFSRGGDFVSGATDPLSIASADFNGDGKMDLAVSHSNSDSVYVGTGDGNGGFGFPSR